MTIVTGIAAVLFVVCCVLGVLVFRIYRSYKEAERERDNLQEVLEGSGVIWSDTEDDDMLEQRYDRILEQESDEEEPEKPGHSLPWSDSDLY